MARLTLLDIAKRAGNDQAVGIVESMSQANALLERLPFRPINGSSFRFGRRTALPTVNVRGYNQGVAASKSTVIQVMVECMNIAGMSEVDMLLADDDPRGVKAVRAEEDASFLAATGNKFNYLAYYGNSATNANERDGVANILNALSLANVAGAGGSGGSSIYFFALNDATGPQGRRKGMQGVLANGQLPSGMDMGLQYVLDADNNKYPAYVTDFIFRPGLAIYDTLSVGRLANIGASNKPTVALISSVIQGMFPFRPSFMTCSKVVYGYILELVASTQPRVAWNPATGDLTVDAVPVYIDENIGASETTVS